MKKTIVLSMFLLSQLLSYGQSQDIQQLIMDIEKLAQMKSMLSSMYNSYNILSQGYNQVSSLTKGNFDLHKNYLDGLLKVSAPVRKYQKIASIVSSQVWLVNECKASFQRFRFVFNAKELLVMSQTYTDIVDATTRNVDQLLMILSPGQLQMSDDQRIAAIDRIDTELNERISSLKSFNESNSAEMNRRLQVKKNVQVSRQLLGVK